MSLNRELVVLTLAGLAILAGCGGGTSPVLEGKATGPKDVSPSPTPSHASPPLGRPVMVTDQNGYKYELRASAVYKTPTLASGTSQPMDAPPGQTFLAINLQVRDPLSDGGEPLKLADHDWSDFVVHFPRASLGAFGVDAAGWGCLGADATTDCKARTKVVAMSPLENFIGPVFLPPAGQPPEMVYLTVLDGAVPESAPVDQMTMFVEFSAACFGPCELPPVPIPLGP